MAVAVLTKDHGEILHKEAATARADELGFLTLFSDKTDATTGISVYAAGTWVSATEVEMPVGDRNLYAPFTEVIA